MKKRIGIVVPGLEQGGGVPAVAEFLCQAIDRSDRYAAEVISVATSSQDPQSVRLLSPASWVQGVCAAEGSWRGRSYRHYGAPLAEVEFMRYRPRRLLTEQLNRYSLVQIVAGARLGRWSLARCTALSCCRSRPWPVWSVPRCSAGGVASPGFGVDG